MTEIGNLPRIPQSWAWVQVGNVVDKPSLTGKKLPQKDYQSEGKLPVIDQGQSFIGGYTDRVELKVDCEPPVIIFGDHTKAIKYVRFDFAAGADGVKVLKPWTIFYPKLFYYFLQGLKLPDKGYARHFQFLEKSTIPLPPFTEQLRIVAKIEELFTKLDAGVEALRMARAQLGRYRQSVLKAAVTGELTKEWREAHRGELEPASELLARILRERREKWEADQLAKMKAAGKKPKDDEWAKGFKEPAPLEVSGLPQIDGWCWVTLDTVADAVDPQPSHRTPPEVTAGIPYVGMGDVTKDKKIDLVNARKVSPTILEEHQQRYQLKEGDFFIGKIGTIGKPVKLTPPFVYALSANVVLIQPKHAHTEGKFAFFYMASPLVEKLLAAGTRATTQAAFGIQKVRLLPYPLPPLAEQQQIVAEVERLLSIADATERTIEQSLKQAERLRQSILKQAYEGKLVPQDPADEPAEVLLARIREERVRKQDARQKVSRAPRKAKRETQMMMLD